MQVSLPTSPTWIAYKGDHQNCLDVVPIAIQRGTFCRVFMGHVRPLAVLLSCISALRSS